MSVKVNDKEAQTNKQPELFNQIVSDLKRMAGWSEIIPFLVQTSEELMHRHDQSPALFYKHKRWLLNTERLSIALVLVYREMSGKPAMSQGEFIRLLGGNPAKKTLSGLEVREVKAANRYWENQMRNNIRPIMADYFQLIHIQWEGGDKPGCGEYSIRPTPLLIQFVEERLYH